MNKKCTILVNSCDSYDDLWDPFFELFHLYWAKCPFDIVLNTESKAYNHKELKIKTFGLYKPDNQVDWSSRILEHLKRIESEYVLIMLDDFFIRNQVDQKRIEQCLHWMESDKQISVFSFEMVLDPNNIKSKKYEGFEKRPIIGKYKFNLQAGIWRKNDLISYLVPGENPWQWEIYGNQRSYLLDKEFYVLESDSSNKIIDYGFIHGGIWGVYRGKWYLQDVEPLFEKHNLYVDFDRRGIYIEPPIVHISFLKKVINFAKKIKQKLFPNLIIHNFLLLFKKEKK